MQRNQPPRGFTLVELAIVIVIAGILAAVAVPIYNDLVNDSKWTEGKNIAGQVRTALDVHLVENNGYASLTTAVPAGPNVFLAPGVTGTAAATAWNEDVGLSDTEFDTKYFVPATVTLATGPGVTRALATYLVTVDGAASTKSGHPDGVFTMDQAGTTTGP